MATPLDFSDLAPPDAAPARSLDFSDLAPPETQYEGAAQEFLEGIVSGGIGAVQGLAELGAAGIDLAADTDYKTAVTEGANNLRETFGIDPEGILGKGAEIITQFVVPGLGAAGLVSKGYKASKGITNLSQLSKAERLGLGARQIAAAGLTDAVVASDGTTTIADFFEGGPTATDQRVGLQGREEALRTITNKFKIGAEAGFLTGVAPLAVDAVVGTARGAGAAGRAAGEAVADTRVGRGVGEKLRALEESAVFGRGAEAVSGLSQITSDFLATLRYRSYLPEEVAESRLLSEGQAQPAIRRAQVTINKLEKGLDKIFEQAEKAGAGSTPLTREQVYNQIEAYLTSPKLSDKLKALRSVPADVRPAVRDMRKQIDELSRGILDSDYLERFNFTAPGAELDLRSIIEQNIGSYMRRKYRVYEDLKYTPDQGTLAAAKGGFLRDKAAVEYELTRLAKEKPSEFTDQRLSELGAVRTRDEEGVKVALTGKPSDEAAELARDSFLDRHRLKAQGRARFGGGRVAEQRLNTGMLTERTNLKAYQRALLGEIKDPRESFISTVADLAEFKAVDDYFKSIRQMADTNEGIGKFFINPEKLSADEIKALTQNGDYVQLGGRGGASRAGVEEEVALNSGWGSLYGYIVPRRIYKDLTKVVMGEGDTIADTARAAYSTFLRAKAGSQYAKTVLSPVTQIRNFTTAVAFALAQGNIGRGANLIESIRLVMDDLSSIPKEAALDELADMQRRGILGTQAELRELQDLINRGVGLRDVDVPRGALGVQFDEMVKNNRLLNVLAQGNKKAQDLYQAGDNVWKIYNYRFEQNKLREALRELTPEQQYSYLTKGQPITDEVRASLLADPKKMDDLLKDRAAQIVRDTVPNYNKAPDFIKALRRAPVGNFVSFPYEILRTGVNTIRQAAEELSSDIPGVRAIGMRRAIGASTTFTVLPAAIAETAYSLTGIGKDEMEAYKRSFGASWEKNALLIPTGRDENGDLNYVNFSSSNPYDLLNSTLRSVMSTLDEGVRTGKTPDQIAATAAFRAFRDFAQTFFDEAIVTEKLIDVTPGLRDGRTLSGAEVYKAGEGGDSVGTQLAKSFNHVLSAFLPGFLPVNVSGGQFEPSRAARGLIPGVGETDKFGRDYESQTELFRLLTGVTPFKAKMDNSLYYRASALRNQQNTARSVLNSVLDNANVTTPEIIDAYRRANEAKLRVDRTYRQLFDDMRTMGFSDRYIMRILEQNNIGGVDGILAGRFEPIMPSDAMFEKMKRNGTLNQFPRAEIRRMYREYMGADIFKDPAPAPTPQTPQRRGLTFDDLLPEKQGSLNQAPSMRQGAAMPPPATLPASAPAPQGASAPTMTASLSPDLLGDNPFEQAANMAIAQRLSD